MYIKILIKFGILFPIFVFSQKYSLRENFINNCRHWPIGRDSISKMNMSNGKYSFNYDYNKVNSWNLWNENPIVLPAKKNFVISMKAKGRLENQDAQYGIRWNNTGPMVYDSISHDYINRNAYAFVLKADGKVALFHNPAKGQLNMVVGWKQMKHYQTNGYNIFTIINKTNHYSFYLNDKKAFDYEIDTSKSMADIGFRLFGKASMVIDYLYIIEK